MASARTLSNPLALAILACLIERPMHPYEMAQTMRERHKHESVKLNYGSLYTVVEALERAGLIVPQETQRQGRRPERTVYAIAEAGREKFYGWLRSLISKPVKEYPQFAAGLSYIAALVRDEAVALLEERAGRLAQDIAETKRSLNELMTGARDSWPLPRLILIELEYELHMKEAELAWVRQIVADIRDGKLEWPEIIEHNGQRAWRWRGAAVEGR